jgi:CheY-like chemotaxis protein
VARCAVALFAFITFGASAQIKRADGAMYRLRGRTFQIFTDIDMPRGSMNGIKLAHAIRGRWPPIKIVTTSSHFSVCEKRQRKEAHSYAQGESQKKEAIHT